MEVKKNVILVNSLCNLIIAFAITNGLKKDEKFDLILSDYSDGLYDIYKSNKLNAYFEKVYFVPYATKRNRFIDAIAAVYPQIAIKYYTDSIDFSIYEHIYAYNPTPLFWYLQMAIKNAGCEYFLHMYGDASWGPKDEPYEGDDINYLPGGKRVQRYIYRHYGFRYVKDLQYDFYIFNRKYFFHKTTREIREIPKLNKSEIESLYEIFGGDQLKPIDEKVIYLDRCHEWGEELERVALKSAIKHFGKDIIVRKHPRQCMSYYNGLEIKMNCDGIPWEVYTMKDDMANRIVITPFSSAAIVPFMLFDAKYTLICMPFAGEKTLMDVRDEVDMLLRKLQSEGYRIFIANSIEEYTSYFERVSINDDGAFLE